MDMALRAVRKPSHTVADVLSAAQAPARWMPYAVSRRRRRSISASVGSSNSNEPGVMAPAAR